MTAEIVNLRRARKAKGRTEAEREADENRAAFDRTKAEKHVARLEREAAGKHLDGHRRDSGG